MPSTSIALLIGLSSSFNVIQSSFPSGGDENIAVSSLTLSAQENKKKSFFQKILTISDNPEKKTSKGFFASSEFQSDSAAETWFLSSSEPPMHSGQQVQSLSVFVATWNVGGKSPRFGINLDDFLQIDHSSDLYVLGFQEIVPLNAGNVLVIEDNDPAARWLGSINQSLNKPVNMNSRGSKIGGSLFFPKPSLKSISNTFRTESSRRLKSCNCAPYDLERKRSKDLWFRCQPSPPNEEDGSSEEVDDESTAFDVSGISIHQNANQIKYSLVACKQMVGIFVTIWMKKEVVPLVSHLRISCVSRGIMGCLGNKGCISVSMLFQQTSFCFICSHLASGEKEGDELRRNVDVVEILKTTQFPKISRTVCSRMPEKIIEHDRVIWLGDLNYRIALSFSETRRLMAENHWDELLNKDQLSMERKAGRVFGGWKEGNIYFAPTYKYWCNSDAYAADVKKSKKYRRTPAWCDRVLWHGDGIRQVSYVRGESQFSDHRPVCATFLVDVGVVDSGLKQGLSEKNTKIAKEEITPPSKH